MATEYHWNREARRTDDDDSSSLPPWTAEGGGCEGVKTLDDDEAESDSFGVPIENAMQQLMLYERNDRRLPRRQ